MLPPGEYNVHYLGTSPSPVVVIQGAGITAILAPSQVVACQGKHLNTLYLSPVVEPPKVQLLRLATTGVDLRFQEGNSHATLRGVLALPLREEATAWSATPYC